jgi:alanine racemase
MGAREVAGRLLAEGCRDFFVSTWWEAAELAFLPDDSLAVLHGFGPDDEARPGVRPVLSSPTQIAHWKASGSGHLPCDVMVDTGMNRLGLRLPELFCASGLNLHTLHSHLACADEDHALNELQLRRFREARALLPAQRYSLANSAGIFLGRDYAFDLVRPGLALYGGIPRPEARGQISPVAIPQAQVLQVREVPAGESVGYNATFVAPADLKVAILNLGYADGYWRALGRECAANFQGKRLPIVGRVSMDLVAVDASEAPSLRDGDWADLEFDLEKAAFMSGMSQYELLTGLGRRFERRWT